MEAEHIDNLEDMQGYFMKRMSDYVRSKGKIPMGWDELTNHELPEGMVIYGWRGFGEAATKAAAQGPQVHHDSGTGAVFHSLPGSAMV